MRLRPAAGEGFDRGDRAIPVSYFIRLPNIGDRINPQIVEAVTGRPARWTGDRDQPHLLAIGSLLSTATAQSHVWGTGLIHPARGIGSADAARIFALRGKLTFAEVRKAGLRIPDVPLGDPAVLVGAHLGLTKAERPRYALGLVPHYVDRLHPFIAEAARRDGVVVLDVRLPPEAFFRDLRECQAIVSSSLHGLVFADALGIPSLWMELTDEIAGEGFKFHDWFSTSSNPQSEPFRPRSVAELAEAEQRCEPREPEIDVQALAAALPVEAVEAALGSEESGRRSVPIAACRARPIPLIVISYNRADYLRQVIASYRRQTADCQIVIHDNGSDDPDTVALLAELEANGARVYRRAKIADPEELNAVDETVQDFFSDWAEPSDYIVTDCDIDLSITDPRAIAVYRELLSLFRHASCVGPMLRIRDIPVAYPLFNRVMNRHIRRLWQQEPEFAETSHGPVAFIEAPFDTVFAVHRAGEPFRRKKKGLRVYEPYEALHLDWYSVGDDIAYQGSVSENVTHWSNRTNYANFRNERLRFSSFRAVERQADGSLAVVTRRIPAEPTPD